MLGVLDSAGAAICLAPCGSAFSELNLGQAINAVTGTRLWAFVFSLRGTVLIFGLSFVLRGSSLVPEVSVICARNYSLCGFGNDRTDTGRAVGNPEVIGAAHHPAKRRRKSGCL